MKLTADAEQRQVKETAKRFFNERAPVRALRLLRSQRGPIGYSEETWKEVVGLGFSATTIPEVYGGLGLGYATLGYILEEAGRTLYASPLLSTLVAGASVIELAGSGQRRENKLASIAIGELTLAFAQEEASARESTFVSTIASTTENGYMINGKKTFVLDGNSADELIVVARTSGTTTSREGISLFMVPRNVIGVQCARAYMVDTRDADNITFDHVEVQKSALLGLQGDAAAIIETVLDRLRICIAAEMLGGMQETFDRTISYLKEREQFGVKIGTFQALKHRAAKMFIEIELTRSAVAAALSALDERSDEVPLLASLAKARANETFRLVSNEAVQMHGGIGITDDLDIGLFLKRARVAAQSFGDTRFHRARYALLSRF